MANYGIKMSKPGKDVKTAGLKDLIFLSTKPVLKIKQSGTGSISYTHDGSSNDILVATHSLGYIPMFMLMMQWYNIETDTKETSYRAAPFTDKLVSGSIYFDARAYANTTQLRLSVGSYNGNGSSSISLDFLYSIYYDPEDL